jgi:hypothetical protein
MKSDSSFQRATPITKHHTGHETTTVSSGLTLSPPIRKPRNAYLSMLWPIWDAMRQS